MAEIAFTEAAIDDLRRIGPDTVPKVLKKIRLLRDNAEAGYPLGGDLTGFRKLVVGRNTWRIVYRITDDKAIEICEVWVVGARADSEVYAEARARVAKMTESGLGVVRLAEVVERLGRLSGDITVPEGIPKQPVPDWLAERLIYTVGLAWETVAAMSLEEAVDTWTAFIAQPR